MRDGEGSDGRGAAGAGRTDAVLVGDHLPELGTDLVATLTALDSNELTHLVGVWESAHGGERGAEGERNVGRRRAGGRAGGRAGPEPTGQRAGCAEPKAQRVCGGFALREKITEKRGLVGSDC